MRNRCLSDAGHALRARPLLVVGLLLLLHTGDILGAPRETATVLRVVDGDTLRVRLSNGQQVRVRLIGIDCPEVHPRSIVPDRRRIQQHAAAATRFVQSRLAGRPISIEYDAAREDHYGRHLVYVWVNGEMLNQAVVCAGWATCLTVRPNVRYAEILRRCEVEARRARRGMWQAL